MVADLAVLAAEMEGRTAGAVGDLGKVTSSSITVETGADDAFESLRADVDLASVTPALRAAFGKGAGRHLAVRVTLDPIERPLKVQSPAPTG